MSDPTSNPSRMRALAGRRPTCRMREPTLPVAVGSWGRGVTTQQQERAMSGQLLGACMACSTAQAMSHASFPDGPKKTTRSGGSPRGGAQRVEEPARVGRRAGLGESAAAQLAERVRVRARQRVLLLQQRALPQADWGVFLI
jgi:hypothetical protein